MTRKGFDDYGLPEVVQVRSQAISDFVGREYDDDMPKCIATALLTAAVAHWRTAGLSLELGHETFAQLYKQLIVEERRE